MRPKTPDDEWDIELDLTTRSGQPLRLVYSTNVETENRGIIVDEVSAFIDNRKVGYLKFELFPQSSLPKFFPSGVVNYMAHFTGRLYVPYQQESTDLRKADIETLQYFVDRFSIGRGVETTIKVESQKQFQSWFKERVVKPGFLKAEQKKFDDFLAFRLNQAFVTYSNTVRPNRISDEPSFARQGIGTALYIAAALELERQGMDLRASKLQSPEAVGLWEYFDKRGLVERRGEHLYMPGSLVRQCLGITLPSAKSPSF